MQIKLLPGKDGYNNIPSFPARVRTNKETGAVIGLGYATTIFAESELTLTPKEVAKIATTAHQNRTLRTIIEDAMKGDDRGIYEYYALHNAKALLALENNICHSYNCALESLSL
mgnify:CR=1 FL=1